MQPFSSWLLILTFFPHSIVALCSVKCTWVLVMLAVEACFVVVFVVCWWKGSNCKLFIMRVIWKDYIWNRWTVWETFTRVRMSTWTSFRWKGWRNNSIARAKRDIEQGSEVLSLRLKHWKSIFHPRSPLVGTKEWRNAWGCLPHDTHKEKGKIWGMSVFGEDLMRDKSIWLFVHLNVIMSSSSLLANCGKVRRFDKPDYYLNIFPNSIQLMSSLLRLNAIDEEMKEFRE